MEIVSALKSALADKVGQQRFDVWFGANTRLVVGEDSLTVSVPNQFYQDWLRTNFRRQLEDSCAETLGRSLAVVFNVDPTLADVPEPHASADASPSTIPIAAKVPAAATALSRRQLGLDSFAIGLSNQLAYASAESVVREPGSLSPLLLYGPTGVGKTHLLEALAQATRRARPGSSCVMQTAEQFTTSFLAALHGSGLPLFRRKYRGVQLLAIDDIQFFAGKKATIIELQHTIDVLTRDGRQLVFTSDRGPTELTELGPELTTRLQGGLYCRIDSPDEVTRLGIVRSLATRLAITLPDDVAELLAARFTSHARELAGALKRLQMTSQAMGAPIDAKLAAQIVAETAPQPTRNVRLADVERAVCHVMGVELSQLHSPRKTKAVNHARMLAMWLARKHTRAALAEIGEYFGRRSHSTVISAQKRVRGWMESRGTLEMAQGTWPVDETIRRIEAQLQAG